jgi:16S rRNA (guanine966-N2)-methyltransferase
MRILGGMWRGQEIEQPKSNKTRPISQKVRQAIFNILGDISGQTVLDLYAGSGAVGLESISRGAAHVVMVESNSATGRVIGRNIAKLGAESFAQAIDQPVEVWLKRAAAQFDLIVADPPYAQIDPVVLNQAADRLKVKGILVVSHSSKLPSL